MGNDTMDNFNSMPVSLKYMIDEPDMLKNPWQYLNASAESQLYMSYETAIWNFTMFTNASQKNMEYTQRVDGIIQSLPDIEYVFNIVTICIALPIICWAVFALFHQVKTGNVTPVYVINLLISDFLQIIGRIVYLQDYYDVEYEAGLALFFFGLGASVLFMVCIALERYLLVVHPLWYRCRRTIKHSILISLAVYVFIVLSITVEYFLYFYYLMCYFVFTYVVCSTFLILPLPLLVFFLGATWRALSRSISVPHRERKRILGTLALVLLIYLVTFLPSMFVILHVFDNSWNSFFPYFKILHVAFMFLHISPLMDPLLYILIKKDARSTLKVPHCCRRLCTHKEGRETSAVPTENVTSV